MSAKRSRVGDDQGSGATTSPGRLHAVREFRSVVGERFLLKSYLGAARHGELYLAVDRSLADPSVRQQRFVVLHILNRQVAQQTHLLQKLQTSYLLPNAWAHRNIVE